eukprot:3937585-Rhodomonas_salina.2
MGLCFAWARAGTVFWLDGHFSGSRFETAKAELDNPVTSSLPVGACGSWLHFTFGCRVSCLISRSALLLDARWKGGERMLGHRVEQRSQRRGEVARWEGGVKSSAKGSVGIRVLQVDVGA